MTKKLLLVLDDETHSSLKEYQIDYTAKRRVMTSLNDVLVEIIKRGTKLPINEVAMGILERAAAKKNAVE